MAKIGIGYNVFTERVYLGKQNKEKGYWIGDKEDITSDFLGVLVQFIPRQSARVIECGDTKSIVLHIDNTKESFEKVIKYLQESLTRFPEQDSAS